MTTKPSQKTTSPRPYKQKLMRAAEMKTAAKALLHERFCLLLAVFEDEEFRAELGGDDETWAVELDKYLDDQEFVFFDLRMIHQHFPSAGEWSQAKLIDLYNEARKRNAAGEEDEVKISRPRVKRAEYEALEQRGRELEYTIDTLTRRAEKAEKEARRIEQLERELRHAYQRIAELEAELAALQAEPVAA